MYLLMFLRSYSQGEIQNPVRPEKQESQHPHS